MNGSACAAGSPTRDSRSPRAAALHAGALAHRPEPPLEARRRDDERRRLRRRLVRRERDARAVQEHRAGLERRQPPRALRPCPLRPRLRAHPCLERDADPVDELPPVPARTLAVDAQRRHRAVPRREARPRVRRRPVALARDRRLDGLGGVLLPRADLRPRGRSADGGRACGRADREGRPRARYRAPDPDDGRDERRHASVGVSLLERGEVALALLLDEGRGRSGSSTPSSRCSAR